MASPKGEFAPRLPFGGLLVVAFDRDLRSLDASLPDYSASKHRYFAFPPEQYRQFLDAESQGRYFLANIRNQFRYERLARLEAA